MTTDEKTMASSDREIATASRAELCEDVSLADVRAALDYLRQPPENS